MANSMIFREEWAVKAQEYLKHPTNWKEICNVEINNSRVLNNPYFTEATVQTTARDSSYSFQSVTLTNESITISSIGILNQKIDRADLAQSSFTSQMEMAAKQGVKLNEYLQTRMLAEHGQYTNMHDNGSGKLVLGTGTNFTITPNNIDNVIRAVKREIFTANGVDLMNRYGAFIVWRPGDWEYFEEFRDANGYAEADKSLRGGSDVGVYYKDMFHYVSNDHTANHIFAGVRKQLHLGIVRDTYGQVVVVDEPADGSGAYSAIGVNMRVDYAFKAWNNSKTCLFDIEVADVT